MEQDPSASFFAHSQKAMRKQLIKFSENLFPTPCPGFALRKARRRRIKSQTRFPRQRIDNSSRYSGPSEGLKDRSLDRKALKSQGIKMRLQYFRDEVPLSIFQGDFQGFRHSLGSIFPRSDLQPWVLSRGIDFPHHPFKFYLPLALHGVLMHVYEC